MIVYFIAIPLIMHGLANLAGVFAPWTKNMQGFKNSTLVFSSGVLLNSTAGKLFSLIWLASSICLIFAGAGVLMHQTGWRWASVLGCVFSLVAILPWWKAVPPGARFGAVPFDILVIGLLSSPLGTWPVW